MQQNVNVTIDTDDDDDDDDDEDDAKREVTQTIEKFVQNRHVQTLKYLQHVIDENRHLRLHIEHLKRRQDDSNPSPGMVDPIEPEETPISEIPIPTPDFSMPQISDIGRSDQATNTDVSKDFEAKYHELFDELNNLKKQHQINREEFQRELERVDSRNSLLEKEFKSVQQQLITVQKQNNDKQIELKDLHRSFNEMKTDNETLINHVHKLEDKNRLLTQSLTVSERIRLELENQNEESKRKVEQTEQICISLQNDLLSHRKILDNSMNEISSLKQQLQIELDKSQELNNDNEELRETIKDLRYELQEKVVQEQQYQREKQMNSNFKEFIQVKRTLQACQQENEHLKVELKKLQIKFLNN